jgi:hypothetical protein
MERQGRELRTIRHRVQPELDSIISRTRRQLDSVLTPEQRKKAEEIRRKHPRPPGPRAEDGPPLDPGGPPPEGPASLRIWLRAGNPGGEALAFLRTLTSGHDARRPISSSRFAAAHYEY